MTQMTKNFSLAELTKSETALRHSLQNSPGDDELNNLLMLCVNVLQPVRDHFGKGVKVNSGYRSPEVNVKVGGSKTSDHCRGMAADIEIPGLANAELAEYVRDNLPHTQVILEFYTQGIPDSGWVHVSYDPQNLKHQSLTAINKDGKTVYLLGIQA